MTSRSDATQEFPLAALRTASLTLLFSTQSHSVGFPALHLTSTTSLASHLSEKELQLLTLYDKLDALTFQRRVLEAGANSTNGGKPGKSANRREKEEADDDEDSVQEKLAEARGNRKLKDAVVEAMVVAKPILSAVHPAVAAGAGETDGQVKRERALLPLITRRDTLSLTTANLSTLTSTHLRTLSTVSQSHRAALTRNIELAQQLLVLEKKREEEREKGRGEEYRRIEEKWKVTKGRWEVVRQVAQAVVVGSGVDWSRDPELMEWVVGWGDE